MDDLLLKKIEDSCKHELVRELTAEEAEEHNLLLAEAAVMQKQAAALERKDKEIDARSELLWIRIKKDLGPIKDYEGNKAYFGLHIEDGRLFVKKPDLDAMPEEVRKLWEEQ